jgi:hypothetical protein
MRVPVTSTEQTPDIMLGAATPLYPPSLPHLMAFSRASRSLLSSGFMPFQQAPAAAMDFTP